MQDKPRNKMVRVIESEKHNVKALSVYVLLMLMPDWKNTIGWQRFS